MEDTGVMQVQDIMERRVVTIGPKETASAAWTRMRRRDIRHLVVQDGDEIVGVITERDLGGRTGRDLRRGRTVKDLMTPGAITAGPDMSLKDAADLMRSRLIGSLPVVDDGELVGIVTATDVFDALGREKVGALSWAERQLLRRPSTSKALGGRTVPRSRTRSTEAKARKRAPRPAPEAFAARLPKTAKRSAGRTPAAQVPANIRVFGTTLVPEERETIRAQLGARLGKFAPYIERVTVRMEDVNGPKGGVDTACRIKVVLSGMPSVVVEEQASDVKAAFRAALSGTVRTVRRTVDRSRTKPLKSSRRVRARR
ncbi:MAG: CBS domain-containing protein [Candidatus Cloacimonetes bacterium]|jgi:CBS domain-containing protein/ribosome-associated translation inhibitor RaiA|nr:CBS domain-containing protein [Candidatus Cloacimonadota bacterium]